MSTEASVPRDMADVIYDSCCPNRRRRRVKWPTIDQPALCRMQKVSSGARRPPAAIAQIKTLAEEALAACYDRQRPTVVDYDDEGLVYEMMKKSPDYGKIINNIYWRARQQSCVLDAYIILIERGFLSWDTLAEKIDYVATDENPFIVYQYLGCFNYIRYITKELFEGFSDSELPVFWLVIMIARGCSKSPNTILETLEDTGILGHLDSGLLRGMRPIPAYDETPIWQCNLSHHGPQPDRAPMGFFGSLLPHGLGSDAETQSKQVEENFFNQFDKIERAFKAFHDLSDEQLIEEAPVEEPEASSPLGLACEAFHLPEVTDAAAEVAASIGLSVASPD